MPSPAPPSTIVCIGGVVADRVVRLAAPPVAGTSNPASVVSSPGGVARNVAENLARLGQRPTLVSVVGDDTVGTTLVTGVRAAGVDARWVRTVPSQPTAEYLAILDPDGELVLGVAVMAVLDALDASDVDGAWPSRTSSPGDGWVVLDGNPRPEVLAHALTRARTDADAVHVVVVAVSAPKITRLPSRLDGVDILFCTREEARAWLAGPGEQADVHGASDADLAGRLCAAGARRIVLTRGAAGALAAEAGGAAVDVPSEPVPVVDVTGGGDALVAGTVAALVDGADFLAAVRHGVHVAGLTVAVPGAVRRDLASPGEPRQAS